MSKKPRPNKFTNADKAFTPPPTGNAVLPRGPQDVSRLAKSTNVGGTVGAQEAMYKSGTTSATEFYIIHALRTIFRKYPRGGENLKWSYQKSEQGGRHMPGGSIVDFVIWNVGDWNIGLRIQTFYWHFEAGIEKIASDQAQKRRLDHFGGLKIIDIYEQDFINDPTGKSAIKLVLEAMQGKERSNPRATGIVIGNV